MTQSSLSTNVAPYQTFGGGDVPEVCTQRQAPLRGDCAWSRLNAQTSL